MIGIGIAAYPRGIAGRDVPPNRTTPAPRTQMQGPFPQSKARPKADDKDTDRQMKGVHTDDEPVTGFDFLYALA